MLEVVELKTVIAQINYAIDNNPSLKIILTRNSDKNKKLQYTNQYTLNSLFPDESPEKVLKRELSSLREEEYLETVIDDKCKNKKLHVFIREYKREQVYIKIRPELISTTTASPLIVVISFHYAEYKVELSSLPYQKGGNYG